ncbi:MAG: FISUMP domain-containing protein, partial [Candidatus Moraniibacteriota bacterium]
MGENKLKNNIQIKKTDFIFNKFLDIFLSFNFRKSIIFSVVFFFFFTIFLNSDLNKVEAFVCGVDTVTDSESNVYDTVAINSQCWMAENMNIGTRIDGSSNQADNSTFEKYCYSNLDSNCDTYGGLYQWNEAMQYSTTEGAQGICPTDWHMPTDAEQYSLENYLKDELATCVATRSGYDCSGATTKLRVSGSSGFDFLLSGYRDSGGSFANKDVFGLFWSSNESSTNAWNRYIDQTSPEVGRIAYPKVFGLSIRCLADLPISSSFTLNYIAGANGSISGTSPQTVSSGGDGDQVEAVPSTGYHFTSWSDASTENPRTDENVTGDITVTASFAINQYTLTYSAGTGGSISGTNPQTVNYNANGTQVTAVPNSGYHFVKWSDDSTQNPRTDTNVTSNISVTAEFALDDLTVKLLLHNDGANNSTVFTDSSNYTKTVSPSGNAKISNTKSKFGGTSGYLDGVGDWISANASSDFNFNSESFTIDFWFYRTRSNVQETFLNSWQDFNSTDNWYTYVSAQNKLEWYPQGYQSGAGPLLTGTTNITQDVWHHATFVYDGAVCRVFLDGNLEATSIIRAGSNSDQAVIFGINSANFSTQPFQGYFDELRVTKGAARWWTANFTPHTTSYNSISRYALTYTPGANGTITGVSSQTVNSGEGGMQVMAVPDSGYRFTSWSDGVLTPLRTDTNINTDISVTANFSVVLTVD